MKTAPRIAWIVVSISILTDGLLAFQGALMATMVEAEKASISWPGVGMAAMAAVALMLRSFQSELKAVGIKLSDVLRGALTDAGVTVPPAGGETK